jgi:nucleotide-binding universal stress UspA family protein
MEIKNILWPSDLSKQANAALPYVQDLANKYGAKVHLLYVAQDLESADHWYGDADRDMLEGLQKRECDFATSFLDDVCKDKLQGCPLFERHIRKGDPAREIVSFAGGNEIDAIVMATHGKGQEAGGGAHFGSVTDRVVKKASVPVFVVQPKD